MSKALRLLAATATATALATATIPFLGVTSAAADGTALTPSTTGYFYAEGIRKPDASPIAPPNLTGNDADRVAAGNLAVAAQAGQEDKVSFALFDLLEMLPGTVVTKAELTLPLIPVDPNNASYGEAPEKVRACAAGDEGFNGDDGASIQDAPARKCDVFSAVAKAGPDGKSYVIDITKLAQTWVDDANDGVALAPAEDAMDVPFQVVFGPAEAIKLSLTFTPASDDLVEAPAVDTPVDTPDTGTGLSTGVAPAPPVDGGFSSGPPPAPAVPAPAPGVPPQAAAPAAPAAAAVPVDFETLRPTTAFWLGGLLLAGVLILLSLIMGDSSLPAATTRPSLLARALASGQRGTGPSLARPTLGGAAPV